MGDCEIGSTCELICLNKYDSKVRHILRNKFRLLSPDTLHRMDWSSKCGKVLTVGYGTDLSVELKQLSQLHNMAHLFTMEESANLNQSNTALVVIGITEAQARVLMENDMIDYGRK